RLFEGLADAGPEDHEQAREPHQGRRTHEKSHLALAPGFVGKHHAVSVSECCTVSRNTSRSVTGVTSTDTTAARRACSTTAVALRLTNRFICLPLVRTRSMPG